MKYEENLSNEKTKKQSESSIFFWFDERKFANTD